MATTIPSDDSGSTKGGDGLGAFLAGIARVGLRGVVPLARLYVGAAAYQTKLASDDTSSEDVRILGLAAMKLAYETGEIYLRNPGLAGDQALPQFRIDERGYGPDFSLAHVLAVKRVWSESRTAKKAAEAPAEAMVATRVDTRSYRTAMRTTNYSLSTPYAMTRRLSAFAPELQTMAAPSTPTSSYRPLPSTSTARGCGCGGGGGQPSAAPSSYGAPSAGMVRSGETCASCGCATAPATRTYDNCPTFRVSCETKQALKDCVKVAVCDFLRCVVDAYCPDGRFVPERLGNKKLQQEVYKCVGQLACSFAHCVPDALCPPDPCPPAPTRVDYLPCDYAVEVLR
jgi:hypothetical protein